MGKSKKKLRAIGTRVRALAEKEITPAQFRAAHPFRVQWLLKQGGVRFMHLSNQLAAERAAVRLLNQRGYVMKWDQAEGCYVGIQ